MKKFFNFVDKMAKYAILALMYITAFVLFFCNTIENEWQWFFEISVLLIVFSMYIWKIYDKPIWPLFFTSGIYLILLTLMWYLPINKAYGLILFVAIGFVNTRLLDSSDEMSPLGLICTIMLSVVVSFSVSVSHEEDAIKQKTEQLIKPEIVKVEYVDKKNKDNIQVYIKGKGIFSLRNIHDDGKLNSGDSVKVLIYQDQIVQLQRLNE